MTETEELVLEQLCQAEAILDIMSNQDCAVDLTKSMKQAALVAWRIVHDAREWLKQELK